MLLTVCCATAGRAQTALPLSQTQTGQNAAETGVAGLAASLDEQLAAAKERLAKVREELAGVDSESRRATALPAGASADEAEEYVHLRERLGQLYELQVQVLGQMQMLADVAGEFRRQASAWSGFAEPPPYSVKLADSLWHEVGNKDLEIQTFRTITSILENEIANAKQNLKSVALSMQQSAEQLNAVNPGKDAARSRWLLELNQLRLRVAKVDIATKEIERKSIVARTAAREAERALLVKKLDAADAHIQFSQPELDAEIEILNRDRAALKKTVEQLDRDVLANFRESVQAQERLNRLRREATLQPGAASDPAEIKILEQALKLLTIRADTTAMRRRALHEMRALIDQSLTLWNERFALSQPHDAKFFAAVLDRLHVERQRLEERRSIIASTQTVALQKLADEQERQKDAALDAAAREQSRQLAGFYRQQADTWAPLQAKQAEFGDLLARTQQEAERRRHGLSLIERGENLAAVLGDVLKQLVSFEVYSVSDTITVEGEKISGTRRVTLGEIMLFLLIINAGFWLAARAVRIGQRSLQYLFNASEDSAALAARLAHIVLALAVVVAALTTMKIPVTVFAFLGGALALAVGFGAQNLLNNFVSGLILLIERPVKTGDIVDVEGVTGRITQIGVRCCQIRRMDGVEMLVPNSAMIEKTVTNWTLSDQKRRASVTIGVAYGSPLEQTQQLIETAVREHTEVLTDPGPLVLFEDFGESAMQFRVYYWLDLAHVTDRQVVASQIRFSLNKRLTEAGICIAYPQRDVHIHSVRPLEVSIAASSADKPNGL